MFSVTSEGPPNAPTFACKVRLALPGQVLEAVAPSAPTKKEAEARAALRLLPQARSHVGPAAPQPSTGSPNPIGMLQESAQKERWAMPAYTVQQRSATPPQFVAVVSVQGPVAGEFKGSGSTKQEARSRAAQAALDAQG